VAEYISPSLVHSDKLLATVYANYGDKHPLREQLSIINYS